MRRRLAGDAAVLYTAHVLGLLLPLLTVPYLARVLRPAGWGVVVFAQSLGAWLALVAEYGFDLSGTRAVARHLDRRDEVAGVAAGVQGAKLIVITLLLPVVLGLLVWVPTFRAEPALLLWAWAFAVARGLNATWYFHGSQRLRMPAILDASARSLAAIGVFIWVKAPEHGWRVLALQAVFMSVAAIALNGAMYSEIRFRLPSSTEAIRTLREAAGVFIFRGASGLYYQANAFVLGLLGTPQAVAFFAGAEKVVRAGIGMYQPLTQALFPRMSRVAGRGEASASSLLRLSLALLGGMGLLMAAVFTLFAPLLVDVILGPGYEQAVPVLRLLAPIAPIIALGTLFGLHWAIPVGLERPFYLLVIWAAALNLFLALMLVPTYGAPGMAAAVLCAEVLVAGGLIVIFRARGGRLWPLTLPVEEHGG